MPDTRKNLAALAIMSTLFWLPAMAEEASEERSSSSVGYLHDQPLEAAAVRSSKRPPRPSIPRAKSSQPTLQSLSAFYIYDATAEIYFDEDRDGYYYGLEVRFDADTDFVLADVYADLYLSFEGGPWVHYYNTENFTLIGQTGVDDYVVATELLSGHPTGHYDVLIELYDASWDGLVASFGPEEDFDLEALPLEDLQKDRQIVTAPGPAISVSSGGGGSIGIGLILLGLAAATRRLRPRPSQACQL